MKAAFFLLLVCLSSFFWSSCITVAPPMRPAKHFGFRPLYRQNYRYAVPYRPFFHSRGCRRR
ncbi:MAG: hypothetical protein ACKOXV_00755 [Bacteroidota bacterium]